MSNKVCVVCGKTLPPTKRSDRRYCKVDCRVRAYNIRMGGRPHRQRPVADSGQPAAGLLGVVAATTLAAATVIGEAMEQPPVSLALDVAQPGTARPIVADPESAYSPPPQPPEAQPAERLARLESAHQSQTQENIDLRRQLEQLTLRCKLLSDRDAEGQANTSQLVAQLANAVAESAALRSEVAEKAARLATSEVERHRLAAAFHAELDQGLALQVRLSKAEIGCDRLLKERDGMQRQRDSAVEQLAASQRAKALADHACANLRAERDELRGQLRQASERCVLLAQGETAARNELAASNEQSQRRKQRFLNAEKEIGRLQDQYEDLEIEYSELKDQLAAEYGSLLAATQDRLIAEYRSLLAAQEQNYILLAQMQQQALTAASQHQHSDYYAVLGENSRLVLECDELQGRVARLKETVARLKAGARAETRPLRQKLSSEALDEPAELPELEVAETTRPRLGSRLKAVGSVVLAGAATALAIEGLKRARGGPQALPAAPQQSAARLPAGRLSPSRLLTAGGYRHSD